MNRLDKIRRRRDCATLSPVALGVSAALAMITGEALAAEEHTTWRSGEFAPTVVWCHAARDIEEVAVANGSAFLSAARPLVEQGRCMVLAVQVATPTGTKVYTPRQRLQAWHSGPFTDGSGEWSVWKVAGGYGLVPDAGGPHDIAASL